MFFPESRSSRLAGKISGVLKGRRTSDSVVPAGTAQTSLRRSSTADISRKSSKTKNERRTSHDMLSSMDPNDIISMLEQQANLGGGHYAFESLQAVKNSMDHSDDKPSRRKGRRSSGIDSSKDSRDSKKSGREGDMTAQAECSDGRRKSGIKHKANRTKSVEDTKTKQKEKALRTNSLTEAMRENSWSDLSVGYL